jgi:hypothetical protein
MQGEETRSQCFMGLEFQFCKMKKGSVVDSGDASNGLNGTFYAMCTPPCKNH